MKSKDLIITLLFLLSLIELSCLPTDRQNNTLKYIKIGETNFNFRSLNYDVADIIYTDSLIVFFDDKDQALYYFKRNGGDLLNKLNFKSLEKEGIEEISSVFIHSKDTIFLGRLGYFGIYQINSLGERIGRWDFDFSLPLENHNGYYSGSFGLGGISRYGVGMYYNDKLGFLTDFHPIVFDQENSFPYLYRMPTLAQMKINKLNKISPFGNYPSDYFGRKIPHDLFSSFAVNDSLVYINWPSSSEITIVNMKSFQESFVKMKSNFLGKNDFIYYSSKDAGEVNSFWNDHNEKGQYVKLIVDSTNGNIYRIAKHRNKNSEIKLDFLESKWSIVKYDKELKSLGEAIFEPGKFNFMLTYVENDTIFLSTMNPYNTGINEDLYIVEKYILK